MAESTVGWFGVREKYCSLTEKIWLISQTSPNERSASQAQRSPLFLVLTIQRDQTRLIGLSSWDTSTCIQQLRYTYFSGIIITWAGHSTNVGFSHILIYKGHVRLKEFGWFGGMLEEFVREKHCSGWKKKRIKPDLRARERGQRVNAPVQFVGPSV